MALAKPMDLQIDDEKGEFMEARSREFFNAVLSNAVSILDFPLTPCTLAALIRNAQDQLEIRKFDAGTFLRQAAYQSASLVGNIVGQVYLINNAVLWWNARNAEDQGLARVIAVSF